MEAEFFTPWSVVDVLAAEFGPFDLDPAATSDSAKAPVWFTEAENGLQRSWFGRVFLNPPYGPGLPSAWLSKAVAELPRCELIVSLVPASVDTRWFREAQEQASWVGFWPGRIRFGGGQAAPFPSAVLVFGEVNRRVGVLHPCSMCHKVFFGRRDAKVCSHRCQVAMSRLP